MITEPPRALAGVEKDKKMLIKKHKHDVADIAIRFRKTASEHSLSRLSPEWPVGAFNLTNPPVAPSLLFAACDGGVERAPKSLIVGESQRLKVGFLGDRQ